MFFLYKQEFICSFVEPVAPLELLIPNFPRRNNSDCCISLGVVFSSFFDDSKFLGTWLPPALLRVNLLNSSSSFFKVSVLTSSAHTFLSFSMFRLSLSCNLCVIRDVFISSTVSQLNRMNVALNFVTNLNFCSLYIHNNSLSFMIVLQNE